ncbi:MAG: metallophosphoesterase family protein [Candidatus Aenigmarchaeota archaeon]|nr:metallophosphoesterase family protein [Candidatus Aenigmarchaeota archaeon]
MKIGVISDLHIGLPSSDTNDFHFTERQILNFFEYIYTTCEVLVLNGDIFECWEAIGLDLNIQKAQFQSIIACYPELNKYITSHIENKTMIYIVGNHDEVVYRRQLFPDVKKYFVADKKVFIAHGHQVAKINSNNSWIGKYILCCLGHAEEIIFKEIDNTLDDVYILFARHENKIYEKYAITQFDKGATGVVFGHTHHPYVKKIGNKFYGNCGCWWGKKDYIDVILIDTKSDELLQYITLGEIDGQIIENIIPNLV